MRSRNMSPVPFTAMIGLLSVLGSGGPGASPQAPMAQQAQLAAQGPMKVDVKSLVKVHRVGDPVGLEITLRDAYDQAVPAPARTTIVVETTSPSGKKSSAMVYFQPGESIQRFQFSATEEGLIRITARQADNELREGGYVVLVGKPAAKPKSGKAKVVKPHAARWVGSGWLAAAGPLRDARPVALRWAFPPDPQEPGTGSQDQSAPTSPRLLFQVSGGGHEFLADGHDAARILVFYMSPDGSGAPTEIRVWLTWSNGELDPQPLRIQPGETLGEATLRSEWPMEARIALVSSSPAYPVEGTREYTVRFGPAIYGISVRGPQRLSLVDNGMVVAEFYDPRGYPIQTATKRTMTFTPISSTVRLLPMRVDIEPGGSLATVLVFPAGLGRAELNVSTPGYKSVAHVVEVTGLTVILLCLGGGIIGGVCAFNALQGSLPWRIFLGVVGGAVLAWLYVYLALPKTESRIAHNLVSVLFVSILGGYLGLQALDFAARQVGLVRGEPKP